MKKVLLITLAALLTLGALSVFGAAAEEVADGTPRSLITVENGEVKNGSIKEGNNVKTLGSGDVVKFGFKKEFDPMIHINLDEAVDTAEYPILAIKAQQSGATKLGGEVFYNEPGAGAEGGKSVKYNWADTAEWQWIVVDLSNRGIIGYLRLDVFDNGDTSVTGMIAALGFFKTEEDAGAFAASEQGLKLGTDPGPESVIEEIKQEDASFYYLYDKDSTISTGWWYAPYAEGKSISVYFESTVWFSKIWFFAYASQNDCPILLSVLDDSDDEVFSREISVKGNTDNTIDLGIALPPGYYTIMFESVEVDEDLLDKIHFVLGSAEESDVEVELTSFGGNTNDNTQAAPAIRLIICEPDPNYTEKPVITPKVTELPTPVPTSVPVPTETEAAPTDGSDNNGGSGNGDKDNTDNNNKGNTWLIVGIAAAGAVIIGSVIAIVAAIKKKR